MGGMKKYLLFILIGVLGLAMIASLVYLIQSRVSDSAGQTFKNKIGGTPSGISFSKEGNVYIADRGYPLEDDIETDYTGFAIWEADSALKAVTPYSLGFQPIQVIGDSKDIYINNGGVANGKFYILNSLTKKVRQSFELKHDSAPKHSSLFFPDYFEYNDKIFLIASDTVDNSIPAFAYDKAGQRLEQTRIQADKTFFNINFIGTLEKNAYFFATDWTDSRSSHLLAVNIETMKISSDFNLGHKNLKSEISVLDVKNNSIFVPSSSYYSEDEKNMPGSLFSVDITTGKIIELKMPSGVNEISQMVLLESGLAFCAQDLLSSTVYIYDATAQSLIKKFNVGDSITAIEVTPDQSKLYVLTSVDKITDVYPKTATNPKLKVFSTANFQKIGEIGVTQ